MTGRRIIPCFLLIVLVFIGCGKEGSRQEQESQPVKLTLPQILAPSLSYKPTNKDIQIALKNAGFYKGKIDGDIGPVTKRAIRGFQAQNNLKIDGEIGPKTWSVLKDYLYPGEEQE